VLEHLDEVSWHELHHAYGPADKVPGLIRQLTRGSDADRQRAVDDLFGSLVHQGTVYEASAAAVPFLAEIAVDQGTPLRWRVWVLTLLSGLANGNEVGNSRDRSASRSAVAKELDKLLPLTDQHGLDVAVAWIAGNCGRQGSPASARLKSLEQSEPAGTRRLAFAIAHRLIEIGRATSADLDKVASLSEDFAAAREGVEPTDSEFALAEVATSDLTQYLR
jgi:hypothetical protein